MKATVIQHTRMHEHILIKIVGGDKAIAAQIIEEFHHRAHFTFFWRTGSWRCGAEWSLNRQQILNHPTMFIGAKRYGDQIARQQPDKPEPVQRGAVQKHLLIANANKAIPVAFIIQDKLALCDLSLTVTGTAIGTATAPLTGTITDRIGTRLTDIARVDVGWTAR